MKNLLRSSLAAATLGAALSVSSFASADAGQVDFGKLIAAEGCKFVEINLQSGLIRFAAKIAATEDPAAAELLRSIRQVRVNVIGLDDTNRAATLQQVATVRADLARRGWEQIVTVREGADKEGDDVAIFMKSRGEEAVEGLVVTVISKQGEAVLVNVVGDIRAEDLAKLGERLDLEPMRKLKLRRGEKPAEKTT